MCSPLLKLKPSQSKSDTTVPDLSTIQSNIDAGRYDSVAQFDTDVNALFSTVIREHGKVTALGAAAAQLRKVLIY